MNRFCLKGSCEQDRFGWRTLTTVVTLLLCCGLGVYAQSAPAVANANGALSVQATHLLGFENTKKNCNGTLSIQDDALQFRQAGKPGAEVKVASVMDVYLSGESKQVGGLPMKLGKAAAPYGGGRVVSLFAHKNYDTLTVEYADNDGGIHGAVFQLNKGQGELARNELLSRRKSITSLEDQPETQHTAEATHERM